MAVHGDARTYAIIGAAMEVHRELGCGFLEAVYQEALGREFAARKIPHVAQVALPIEYKGARLSCDYRADFVCYEAVVVELKALENLAPVHAAQVINYLKATGFETGLLLNFGAPSLQHKRLIHNQNKPNPSENKSP